MSAGNHPDTVRQRYRVGGAHGGNTTGYRVPRPRIRLVGVQGRAISGELPDEQASRSEIPFKLSDLIAAYFIAAYFSVDDTRGQPEPGIISPTSSNI